MDVIDVEIELHDGVTGEEADAILDQLSDDDVRAVKGISCRGIIWRDGTPQATAATVVDRENEEWWRERDAWLALPERERRNILARRRWPRRSLAIEDRTPAWANLEAMAELRRQAEWLTRRTKVEHHVDHVIPLMGKLVSGLNVETNMRIVRAEVNRKKSNLYPVT